MLLERNAVADERHRGPALRLHREPDRERVHRHRADDRRANAADEDLRAGHVAPEPVGVADRDDPDPRLLRRDEAATVPGALPRAEPPDLRELRLPAERGPKPEAGRVGAERVDSVERDPAACGVEAGRRQGQRGGAVRRMAGHAPVVGRGRGQEPAELLVCERGVAVRRREVGHQPDDRRARRGQLAQPPTAHARVELEVEGHALRQALVCDGQLEPRLAGRRDIRRSRRPEHDDARVGKLRAEHEGLADRRHAERRRAAFERCTAGVRGAVAVPVGLDDRPQLRASEDARERPRVVADRADVDGDERAGHDRILAVPRVTERNPAVTGTAPRSS